MRITAQKGFTGINETVKLQSELSSAAVMSNFKVTDSGSLAKRKGYEAVYSHASGKIRGIWCGTLNGEETVVFAAEGGLYRMNPHVIEEPVYIGDIAIGETIMFGFGGLLYIKVGAYYYKFDGTDLITVEGYTPLVAISCRANGEGEIFEQINLITDNRRQLFSGDGSSTDYYLAEKEVDGILSVLIDGEAVSGYELGETKDFVRFEEPPAEGLNNIEVTYCKPGDGNSKSRIFGCTKIMTFGGNSDGRIFLWGNQHFPNYRFHSDLANGVPSAEYFPVNGYTIIGNSKINCIVQQYDRMLIFNENEAFYSYCELREDGLGNTYSSFPVYSLNGGKGCLVETAGCVIDNKPVTLCNDGLNIWQSTSLPDEKNAVCISNPIKESMMQIIIGDKKDIYLFDFQSNRELYLIKDETAYIYNYGNGCWYIYDQFGGEHFTVCGTTLYFNRDNVIYAFGEGFGDGQNEICSWQSVFTDNGQKSGRGDILSFEADIYVKGPVTLNFVFEKSGSGEVKSRTFNFDEGIDGFRRISFRPALKRAMPFRLTVTQTGTGDLILHGMCIKTRERERSDRFGIL